MGVIERLLLLSSLSMVLLLSKILNTESTKIDGPILTSIFPAAIIQPNTIKISISCQALAIPTPTFHWWDDDTDTQIEPIRDRIDIRNDTIHFLPFHEKVLNGDVTIPRRIRCRIGNVHGTVISSEIYVKPVITSHFDNYIIEASKPEVTWFNSSAVLSCDVRPDYVNEYIRVVGWMEDENDVKNDVQDDDVDDEKYITVSDSNNQFKVNNNIHNINNNIFSSSNNNNNNIFSSNNNKINNNINNLVTNKHNNFNKNLLIIRNVTEEIATKSFRCITNNTLTNAITASQPVQINHPKRVGKLFALRAPLRTILPLKGRICF
ncbi:hypothetical protein HELRODRAFT_176496 [Helobdella robusta]|uniref:Ig-like domain-containing protein n=1 Tax=Helobdella robusta TaxID=6412 RepID=T1FAL0_HELRO|nr:hypothetical protein HELRODRAFT_176496 [Helobdella robusta]ESN99736.1 hypothetical protein HELRODRAFT_176496 [Helobdella robusta]